MNQKTMLYLVALLFIAGCSEQAQKEDSVPKIVCAPGNGGITLPEGFCATLVVEELGLREDHSARHIAVANNGDIYMKTRSPQGGIVALRDTNGDFRADIIEYFSDMTGNRNGILWETGMAIHDGYLWASNTTAVYRWPLPQDGELVPKGEPEIVVGGFPEQNSHESKAFTFDQSGNLYVAVGAPSNACQQEERTSGSAGILPCPILEEHGGIWRFSATQTGQVFSADARYATGLRNVVGLDWNVASNSLFVMQHGRDQLHTLWPDYYTVEDNAELPSESMFQVNEGDQFSWPYGYFDHRKNELMLSPEYGGDGEIPISESEFADRFEEPVLAFPGHWAPNDLYFYLGDHFPERYHGGAFIAFMGSWNRAPLPQQGYQVVFVPFNNGQPSGDYEVFADGFAGVDPIPNRGAAVYRPMGLTMGPDGALFISDYKKGRIWRVVYTGESTSVENEMGSLPGDTNDQLPAEAAGSASDPGEELFSQMQCNTCHSVNAENPVSTGPPLYDLYQSEVTLQNGLAVIADEGYLRESILQANAKIVEGYMPVMPSYENLLGEDQVNHLISYIKIL